MVLMISKKYDVSKVQVKQLHQPIRFQSAAVHESQRRLCSELWGTALVWGSLAERPERSAGAGCALLHPPLHEHCAAALDLA